MLISRTPRMTRALRRRRPCLEGLEERALLNAGDLDLSFNGTGMLTVNAPNSYGGPSVSVAVQSDLKTIIAGPVTINARPTARNDIVVNRFNVDGTPDTSFGTAGQVDLQVNGSRGSLQLQGDGKILLAGTTRVTYGNGKNAVTRDDLLLVRLNTNGSLDTSFGSGGMTKLDLVGTNLGVMGVAIQPGGKIVVSSQAVSASSSERILLARYNVNGTIDTSFGTGNQGYSLTPGVARAMALDGAGKILVAGVDSPGTGQHPAAFRFTSTGLPDASFGSNGVAVLNPPDPSYYADGIGVQSTGQIVVGGVYATTPDGFGYGGAARLTTNGTLDTTFGSNGYFLDPTLVPRSLTIQPDDKVLLVGFPTPAVDAFLVDRVLAGGQSDPTFGVGGQARAAFAGTTNNHGNAAVVGPDGKITVLGDIFTTVNGKYTYIAGIARFQNDIAGNQAATVAIATASASLATTSPTPDPVLVPRALDGLQIRDITRPLARRRTVTSLRQAP